MNCQQTKDRLMELTAGDIPADLRDHLAGCDSCLEEAKALTKSSAWLSLMRQAESPQLSPAFWVRFWERRGRVPDFWTTLTMLARRVSVGLAVVLLALFFGLQLFQAPQEPAFAGLDQPDQFWAMSEADLDEPASSREQVMVTLVARTE